MTLPSEQDQQRGGPRRRGHRARDIPVTLLAAVVIALVIYWPMSPWSLSWSQLEFLLPWMLAPSTGVLPLALVLLILIWVPVVLRSLTGGTRRPSATPPGDDPAKTSSPSAREEQRGVGDDQLEIPAMSFRQMGTEHRWELAEALDIPWRDELIHDHQSWAIACLEAAQRRAERPFS
ncbi:hypothetical protein ACT3SQ_01960 [Brachybacterium sp. AOP42-C2-15]|uniref:hypothetical protein n=1 Tax=unclassified Brachybacterium TaxID=2623841 RepID=UPI003F8EFFB2